MKEKIPMIPIKKWLLLILLALAGLMLLGTLGKSLPFLFGILWLFFIFPWKNEKQGILLTMIIPTFLILGSICLTHIIVSKKPNREKEVYGLSTPFSKVANLYLYKSWYLVQKEHALMEFINHPFIGCGGGNLLNVINLKNNKLEETDKRPVYDPLSTYTGVLAEYGILGLLALLFLMFTIYKEIVQLPDSNNLKWIFICSFSYFMLEAISTDIQNFRHLWVLLGFFGVTLRSQLHNNNA
jgi:hypothetical protein